MFLTIFFEYMAAPKGFEHMAAIWQLMFTSRDRMIRIGIRVRGVLLEIIWLFSTIAGKHRCYS